MTFQVKLWQRQLLQIVLDGIGGSTQSLINYVEAAEFEGLSTDTSLPQQFDIVGYVTALLTKNGEMMGLSTQAALTRDVKNFETYGFILDFMSQKDAAGLAVRNANGSFNSPLAGADEFTWVFLQGALATNMAANNLVSYEFLGLFGRLYNDMQYEIRFGETPGQQKTSDASNLIAREIAEDVLDPNTVDFPTLYKLGHTDGQEGSAALWRGDGGRLGLGENIGGWAGTPFFMLLREPTFFQRDLLYYQSPNNNYDLSEIALSPVNDPEASGYDLLAFTQAFVKAGLQSFGTVAPGTNPLIGVAENFLDAVGALDGASSFVIESIVESLIGIDLAADEIGKANDFFEQSYRGLFSLAGTTVAAGITALALRPLGPLGWAAGGVIGGAVFSTIGPHTMVELGLKATNSLPVGRIALGTNDDFESDVISKNSASEFQRSSDADDIVHAGKGDDLIIADGGYDIIDGGEGEDTVDYSNFDHALQFNFLDIDGVGDTERSAVTNTFRATVSRGDFLRILPFQAEDMLYGIEKVVGTNHDDKFHVGRLTRDLNINAGQGNDFLSFREGLQAVLVEFGPGGANLAAIDESLFGYLTFSNIEGLEGSEFDDVFVINTLAPTAGGNAIDQIGGADGIDLIDLSGMDSDFTVRREHHLGLPFFNNTHIEIDAAGAPTPLKAYDVERVRVGGGVQYVGSVEADYDLDQLNMVVVEGVGLENTLDLSTQAAGVNLSAGPSSGAVALYAQFQPTKYDLDTRWNAIRKTQTTSGPDLPQDFRTKSCLRDGLLGRGLHAQGAIY